MLRRGALAFVELIIVTSVDIDYFSINATFDFKLLHTTDATKKLRFLSLKGAVEDNKIRWWRDEREFVQYAAGISPIGWENRGRRQMRQLLTCTPASEFTTYEDAEIVRQTDATRVENVEIKDWRRSKRKRVVSRGDNFVYILTDVEGKRHSYVGYTPHLDKRLAEHNAGVGANSTKGEAWAHFAVFKGFADRGTALRFESLMHLHSVDGVKEWLDVAREIIGRYPEFNGVALVDE